MCIRDRWIKDGVFVVRDHVATTGASTAVFQLNLPAAPTVAGRRATVDTAGSRLDLHVLGPDDAPLDVVDWAATDGDMNDGFRVDVPSGGDTEHTFVTVLAVDGALDDAWIAGDVVALTLANGQEVEVQLAAPGTGGTFAVDGGAGTTFGPGVEGWPLLAP